MHDCMVYDTGNIDDFLLDMDIYFGCYSSCQCHFAIHNTSDIC